ncbi:MAG: hypothetical protein MUF58_03650 [Arcicella sp.]|jgi:hypothetical protein|nr:hypothetical protein [Arcicella sp.]
MKQKLPLSIIIYILSIVGGFTQNPSSLRWSQINTPHFRLIFPSAIAPTANRTANVLEKVYLPVSSSLGKSPRPISIIIQNQNTDSNGFVTILPRRSEFFLTPPQDYTLLGTNNWLDLLAVHEFRHVVQYDKALTGFSKLFYHLFGNNGLAVVTGVSVPNWFWEGDAVGIESSLTSSGRGRIPTFDMALRTQLLSGKQFSYAKAVCGSFRDFIPNHYVSGYFMTTHLKNNFGNDIWGKILEDSYRKPFYPFSFSSNIKQKTKLTTERLYNETFKNIKDQWTSQISELKETPAKTLKTTSNSYFTNYHYPQILADGRVLAIKSGLSDIQQLVILDTLQNEEKVLELGILNDSKMLSVSGSKVVWTEFNYDPRWDQKNFSAIKLYDFNSNRLSSVTHKSKFLSAALSGDGNKIVAVENSTNDKCSLVILETVNGREFFRIPNPSNALYTQPRWDGNSVIYAVKLLDNRKSIVKIEAETGREETVFVSSKEENISHPVKIENFILFNSGITGVDNIFAYDLEKKQRFQVTNRKFGAFNPCLSADNKHLYFNDFTINGHNVAIMPFDSSTFLSFDETINKPVQFFGQMVLKEAGENLLQNIPTTQFPIRKYSKANILNPYTWGLVLNSLDANSLNLGISSKDLLSTTTISTGYTYNANENRGQYYANLTYAGWYPTISLNYTNGERQAEFYIDKQAPFDTLVSDTWRQQQIVVGLGLPLTLTRSKYLQTINLGLSAALTQISGYDLKNRTSSLSFNGNLNSMIYSFSYIRQLKRSPRDIAPKFAQAFSFYLRNMPFGGDVDAGVLAMQGSLFFPGVLRHHSLQLRGGIQTQNGFKNAIGAPNDKLYVFGSPILFPRGHLYRSYENLAVGSVEYRLPLFDPDWNLGRVLYLKRFKTNIFLDYAKGYTDYNWTEFKDGKQLTYRGSNQSSFTSIGFDFTSQFHFMRFSQQFEIGCRFIYLPDKNQQIFQPLLVNIGF